MVYSKKNSFSKKKKTIRRKMKGGGPNEDLISAAYYGNLSAVKSALENGADVNAKNKDNDTALHFASNEGHTDVVRLLLAAGADIEAKNNNGYTALDKASYLLDAARPWAALDKASYNGRLEIVELLRDEIGVRERKERERKERIEREEREREERENIRIERIEREEREREERERKKSELHSKLRNLDPTLLSIFKKLGIDDDDTRKEIAVDFFDEKGAESLEDLKYGKLVKKFCKKMKLKDVKRDRLRELIFREIGIPDNQPDFTDSEGSGKKKRKSKKSKRTKRKTRKTRKNK